MFWLEGGPGAAATQAIGPVSQRYLQGLRADHDLVFVDQRGTGKSNPLKCDDIGETPANLDTYFGKLFPIDSIRACREKLEKVADLTRYSTSIAMDDLDEVRQALGYEKIHLAGASYGTLAAQVYMRQHPDRVRSAFLIGIATPGFRLPLPFARAAQNALEHLFVDCAADPACRTAFPNLRDEFAAVLARFDRGPLVVTDDRPGHRAGAARDARARELCRALARAAVFDQRGPFHSARRAPGVPGRLRALSDDGQPLHLLAAARRPAGCTSP